MFILLLKIFLGISVYFKVTKDLLRLKTIEQNELKIWETIFEMLHEIQKTTFTKTKHMREDYNHSKYNVIEYPNYCFQSDAYKILHRDILLEDRYVWRDFSRSNLQKRIVTEKTYAVLPNLRYTKRPQLKWKEQLPIELTYIYTFDPGLFNYYQWGQGLGCTFQKYNHMPGASSIAQKNQLINNQMAYIDTLKEKNKSEYCQRNASFIPQTYRLSIKQDCLAFFAYLNSQEHQMRFEKYGPQFIIKTNQHRGEGITVLFEKELSQIKQNYSNGLKCGLKANESIAQRYISNPFLYKGHKIEFRIYFLIASTKPMIVYSYRRALIKRCAKPFDINSTEKAAHVCNTAIVAKTSGLHEDHINNKKSDDDQQNVESEEYFIDWNLEGVQDLLLEQGRISSLNWLDEYLYPRIHQAIIHMIRSTYHTFGRDSRFSEFMAVDMMLDDNLDVWVLEVNHNPQVLSVTPDRIIRNYKMVEDTIEIQFAYIKSKYIRLQRFLLNEIYPMFKSKKLQDTNQLKNYTGTIEQLLRDRLVITLNPDNLYTKIMDEDLKGAAAYRYLIQPECLQEEETGF